MSNSDVQTFSFPTTIEFGPGAIERLPGRIASLGASRPLLVTDAGMLKTDAFERVKRVLDTAKIRFSVYSGVQPNPMSANVDDGAAAFKYDECDIVLAVGGGSPIDAGKAIRLRSTHSEALIEFDDARDGASRIRGQMPPMIAVPTTAGTGSEVGRSAVITIPEVGRKVVIFSPHLMANVAICDPQLTLALPPFLTAATGMDALSHNLEALAAKGYHPICEAIAYQGVALVAANLGRAVKDGKDIEARKNMLMASMMGAIAFQKGLGAAHSLAHPLSTEVNMQHGLANALALAHVVRFNRDAAADAYVRAARAFGLPQADAGTQKAVDALSQAIAQLNADIGLPTTLSAAGVKRDLLPLLADKAFEDACHQCNPRTCSRNDLFALYEAAF